MSDPYYEESALVALTQAQKISAQHARDMLRRKKTAETCGVSVFTMDSNSSARTLDSDRHFVCAFDTSAAVNVLKNAREHLVVFRQIVLDYCWTPTALASNRWKESFYATTIPRLAEMNVLEMGGLIILPFEPHTLSKVALLASNLEKHYSITVLYKHALQEITLWTGTMARSPETMAGTFGNAIDQEELYC
jgi:hypothetical protein